MAGTFPDVITLSSTTSLVNATHGNHTILAAGGAGGITLTLPAADDDFMYFFKKSDSAAGAVTIDTTSSQTIDGSLTYALVNQYQMVWLVNDGSNWFVILAS